MEFKKIKKRHMYRSPCAICTWVFFVIHSPYFPPPSFLFILRKKLFGGPTTIILSPPLNQKPPKKFSLIFSNFFSILPKIHSTKHTLNLSMEIILHWILRNEIQRMKNVCSVPISLMGFLVTKDKIKYKIL